MAKRVEEIIAYGGKEGQMSGLGTFFLIIGILGLIASVVVSGFVTKTSSYSNWGEDGILSIWIAAGIVGLIQGIALFVVLNAGAEVIRLLKKLNGLKFGGEISEPDAKTHLKCSECGNFVLAIDKYDTKCRKCGEEFESIKKEEA